jgi:hypothetical protein
MMDVKIAAGATVCAAATSGGDPLLNAVLRPVFDTNGEWVYDNGVATGHATGEWMRLYLFDVPEGSSMRILAIAIVAPESRFERVVEAAAPVVDSIEFHAPRPTLQFEILDRAFRARQPGGLRVGVVVRRRLSGCSAHEQPRLPCLRSSRWSRRTR